MTLADRLNAALRPVPAWPIYIVAALPPAWLLWRGVQGQLGADPVKAIEHQMGLWALQLLIAGLAITPLRRFLGLNLLRYRRAIGVTAFVYVVLHLLAWLVLDMGLLWGQALQDIVKRPYITVGMASLLLLTPLALTSNDWSVRRLGGMRWRRLHRLVYPAVVLGAVHYLWLVKSWPPEPIVYLTIVLALLALRLIPRTRRAAA